MSGGNGPNEDKELAVKSEVISSLILSKEHVDIVMGNIKMLTEGFKEWLEEDVDYTKKLFGRSDKPSLLDPGTSKINNFFQVRPRHRVLDHVLCTEEGDERVKYIIAAELVNPKTGYVVAEGTGSCSTDEVKYQYRWLTESKLKNEQGLTDEQIKALPFREMSGRGGGKFRVYRIRNPEILDLDNTILKMASKRAEMDAALQLPGVGAVFTQDLGDTDSAIRKHVDAEMPAPSEAPSAPSELSVGSVTNYLRDGGVDVSLLGFEDELYALLVTPLKWLGDAWGPVNDLLKPLGASWMKPDKGKAHWRIPKPEESPEEEPPQAKPPKAEPPKPAPLQKPKSMQELEYILDGKFPGASELFTVVPGAKAFLVEATSRLDQELVLEMGALAERMGGVQRLKPGSLSEYVWEIPKGEDDGDG